MESSHINKDMDLILNAEHHDPFSYLGMHPLWFEGKSVVVVRAFLPEAQEVSVIDAERPDVVYPMNKRHPDGIFEATIGNREKVFPYRLRLSDPSGNTREFHDPYSFLPIMSSYDLHLFAEGKNYFMYRKMGAHILTQNNISGVYFTVWAPNAVRGSIVGEFGRGAGRGCLWGGGGG